MNSQIVTVNLVPGLSTPAVVRVSQYDVGRPILFKVFDGTMPASFASGTIATVVGTKPSGLGFYEVAAISGNTASLNSTLAMTQEAGMIQAEVRFSIQYGPDIGTANFVLAVEKTPHAEGTTDGTQETMANLETRLQGQIDALDSRVDAIEGDQSIVDELDALDTRVTALEQGGSGISQTEKNLILQLFSKAAYAESDAGTAYDALETIWNTTSYSVSWSGNGYTKGNNATSVIEGSTFTSTVTANTGFTITSVTATMGGATVTGAWSGGTVTIPNVTGNIVITVVTSQRTVSSISAVYTQSGTVYDTDTLDSLKSDLVVTATFSDSTTRVIAAADYTLSGTLTVGTSTITVSYGGQTTTFTVTVSHMEVGLLYSWDFTQSLVDSIAGNEMTLAGNATRDSSGLKITSASDYASANVGMTSGRRIEIDIASYTRGNGASHGRFITHSRVSTSQFDCGVVWRSTNVLSVYEGSWADSSVTDINDLTGKTLGYEFNGPDAGSSTVYLDGVQVATISHSSFNNVVDTVELGSQSGQSGFILTVTAMRVYELTQ